MRLPAELYQPSARRLDELIKMDLYDLGAETRKVSQSGFIAHNKRQCFVGEAFAGMEVSLDEDQKPGLTLVCFANVKLGWLENAPNARLRPPAYAERWESKTCKEEERS